MTNDSSLWAKVTSSYFAESCPTSTNAVFTSKTITWFFFFLIFHFNWTPFVILFSLFTATGNSVTQSTQGLCLSYQFNVIPILFLMQITTYNLHFCKRKLKVNNKGHHVCYINIFDLIFNLKLKSVQRKSSYIDDSNFLLDMNYRFTQPISEKIKNSLSVLAFLYILSFFLIWRIINYFGFWYFIQMSFVFFFYLKSVWSYWTVFGRYLMKIYIPMKETQLKSMKWKLSQDIFIDKLSLEKNHKIEKIRSVQAYRLQYIQ